MRWRRRIGARPPTYSPGRALTLSCLNAGPDLAGQLAAYCERMISTALRVVTVHGTYIPSRKGQKSMFESSARGAKFRLAAVRRRLHDTSTSPASRHSLSIRCRRSGRYGRGQIRLNWPTPGFRGGRGNPAALVSEAVLDP